MKNFWNERYKQAAYSYGMAPNVFFAEQLQQIPKGSLLLPAEGEGRNAVYAAIKGWQVHAFDFSDEGRNKAMKLAEKYDVTIDYEVCDVENFEAKTKYEAIALVFAHFDQVTGSGLFSKLEAMLCHGGYLIMEVFSKNQLGKESGGPKSESLLYSKQEIKDLFPNLQFHLLEETKVVLDEGPYHQGEAAVIRALAQNSK
jgi:hypothetical protein